MLFLAWGWKGLEGLLAVKIGVVCEETTTSTARELTFRISETVIFFYSCPLS